MTSVYTEQEIKIKELVSLSYILIDELKAVNEKRIEDELIKVNLLLREESNGYPFMHILNPIGSRYKHELKQCHD